MKIKELIPEPISHAEVLKHGGDSFIRKFVQQFCLENLLCSGHSSGHG